MLEWIISHENTVIRHLSMIGEIVTSEQGFNTGWSQDEQCEHVGYFTSLEAAKSAVIEAERAELQRRAEQIGYKLVEDTDSNAGK